MPDRAPEREQRWRLIEILSDPEAAVEALPESERRMYEECQQSVVDARRAAEREGASIWIQ